MFGGLLSQPLELAGYQMIVYYGVMYIDGLIPEIITYMFYHVLSMNLATGLGYKIRQCSRSFRTSPNLPHRCVHTQHAACVY